jgi:Cdc6-like AAA superfamily ATPase
VLSNRVKSLSNILRDVEELLPERDLTDRQKTDMQHVTEGCSSVLTALEKVLDKYRDLDTSPKRIRDKSRRVWKRLKWEPDDIRDLRLRIVSSIGLLNAFNGTIARDSHSPMLNNGTSLNYASQFSSETKQGVDELGRHNHDVENQAIIDWLTPIDYSTQQSDFIARRQKGTGQWLLDSDEFQRWQNDSKQTLFCPGIPGAGKTMITSIVIDHLCDTFQNEADIGIAYLYCNYRRKEEQSPDQLLLSLVKQLVQELPSVPDGVKNLYERHKGKRTRPSFDEISTVLHSVVVDYSRVFIIIDALDECHGSDGHRQKVLSEVFSLQAKTATSLLATSRFIPEITKQFEGSIFLEIRASDEDVRRYLDGKIPQLRPFVSRSLALQEEIKAEIIKAVDGMYVLPNAKVPYSE